MSDTPVDGPMEFEPDPNAQLPPPSLTVLASMLASQAMMAMGHLKIPGMPEMDPQLPQARHLIDLLAVLEQKTEGNRSAEETQMIGTLLHELRMAFMATPGGGQAG